MVKLFRMKKILSPISLGLVVLSLFSCESSGLSLLEDETITIAVSGKNKYKRERLANKFKETHPNYKFNFIQKTENQLNYYVRHNQLEYDILCIEERNEIRRASDRFVNLATTEYLSRFSKAIQYYITFDNDAINCLPSPGGFYCYVFNRDLRNRYNLSIPTSLPTLMDYATYINNFAIPFVSSFSGNESYLDTFRQSTIPSYFATPKGNNAFHQFFLGTESFSSSNEYESIQNIRNYCYRYRYLSGFADANKPKQGSVEDFLNGKAMCRSITPSFSLKEQRAMSSSEENFDYVFLPYFGTSSDESWIPSTTDFFYAIDKHSYQTKKRALDAFSNYFSSDEGQQILRQDEEGNRIPNRINYLKDSSFHLTGNYQQLNPLIEQGRIYFVDDFLTAFRPSISCMCDYIEDNIDAKGRIEARDVNRSKHNNYSQNSIYINELDGYGNVTTNKSHRMDYFLKTMRNKDNYDGIFMEDSFVKDNVFDGTIYEDELNTIFDSSIYLKQCQRTGEELLAFLEKIKGQEGLSQCGFVLRNGKYLGLDLNPIQPKRTYHLMISNKIIGQNKLEIDSKNEVNALEYLKACWFKDRTK